MTRFRLVTAGVLLAGLVAVGAADAQGPRGGAQGPRGRGTMTGGLPLASLDLSQAQQDLIRDIRERGRESATALETRVRAAREAQRQALDVIPLSEAQVRTATIALADAEAEVQIHQARVRDEIFAVLTAQQQAQVRQQLTARQERQQQMEERRREMRDRRPTRRQ